MTIAIAVSVSEGLVLTADSRTTHWVQAGDTRWPEVVTDHARKVFPLSDRVGAMTYGRSQINRQTVAALVDRFRVERPATGPGDVDAIMEAFFTLLRQTHEAENLRGNETQPKEHMGFIVAGYGQDGVGKLYEVRFPDGAQHLLSSTESPNYHWRGHGDSVGRLMKGIDPHVDRSLLSPEANEQVTKLEYAVRLRDMSLEDAVDFTRFLAEVARGVDRFVPGTLATPHRYQLIGGSLTIAIVTHKAFTWVTPSSLGTDTPAG